MTISFDQSVQSLCSSPKFSSLKDYIQCEITIGDLDAFTEKDFICMTHTRDVLLMKLFYRTVLSQYMGLKKKKIVESKRFIVPDYNGHVDLTRRATSAELITIDNVLNSIPIHIQKDVKILTLLECDLIDTDLPHIKALVDRLSNVHNIDLSNNCIVGCKSTYDMLLAILARSSVKSLNILNNPIVSSIYEDVFSKEDIDPSWAKLIWTSETHRFDEKCDYYNSTVANYSDNDCCINHDD